MRPRKFIVYFQNQAYNVGPYLPNGPGGDMLVSPSTKLQAMSQLLSPEDLEVYEKQQAWQAQEMERRAARWTALSSPQQAS